jgi:hypothetical protein
MLAELSILNEKYPRKGEPYSNVNVYPMALYALFVSVQPLEKSA